MRSAGNEVNHAAGVRVAGQVAGMFGFRGQSRERTRMSAAIKISRARSPQLADRPSRSFVGRDHGEHPVGDVFVTVLALECLGVGEWLSTIG